MKADPPVRDDGRCAREGCKRKLPRNKQLMRYAGEELLRDPFCSTGCCRTYHGCELAKTTESGGEPEDWTGEQKTGTRFAIRGARKAAAA